MFSSTAEFVVAEFRDALDQSVRGGTTTRLTLGKTRVTTRPGQFSVTTDTSISGRLILRSTAGGFSAACKRSARNTNASNRIH